MKTSLKKFSTLCVVALGLSTQASQATPAFTAAQNAIYKGHNEGFHGFEVNNTKYLVPKAMTNLDQGSKNFPNFGGVINFALKQKMTLKADLSCAKAPCEVKVVQGAQVIQGPVNVSFKAADLTAVATAMKTTQPHDAPGKEGQGMHGRR